MSGDRGLDADGHGSNVASEPEPAAADPGWAHNVVPDPYGAYPDPDTSEGLPGRLAAYHAARAYGFWLGSQDGGWPEGIRWMLYEYQLALVWSWHAVSVGPSGVDMAVAVVTDLASPHVIGPNILTLLEQAGVDPGHVKAYGPSKTKEQAQ